MTAKHTTIFFFKLKGNIPVVISEEMNDIKEQIRTDMHNMIMKMKESLYSKHSTEIPFK